jgi:hypothetical protein
LIAQTLLNKTFSSESDTHRALANCLRTLRNLLHPDSRWNINKSTNDSGKKNIFFILDSFLPMIAEHKYPYIREWVAAVLARYDKEFDMPEHLKKILEKLKQDGRRRVQKATQLQ